MHILTDAIWIKVLLLTLLSQIVPLSLAVKTIPQERGIGRPQAARRVRHMDVPNQSCTRPALLFHKSLSRGGTAPLAPIGFPILHINKLAGALIWTPLWAGCNLEGHGWPESKIGHGSAALLRF